MPNEDCLTTAEQMLAELRKTAIAARRGPVTIGINNKEDKPFKVITDTNSGRVYWGVGGSSG